MAKSSPEVLVKLSKNPKKRTKMLINEILTEKIQLKELKPDYSKAKTVTYNKVKYDFDEAAALFMNIIKNQMYKSFPRQVCRSQPMAAESITFHSNSPLDICFCHLFVSCSA